MTKSNGTSATLDTIAEDLKNDQASGVSEDDEIVVTPSRRRSFEEREEERNLREEEGYARLKALLDQPLDPTLIKKRKAYDGKTLDYLEHHTITTQLNTIFGYGKWSTEVREVHDFYSGEAKDGVPRGVRVTMELSVYTPGISTSFQSVGYAVVQSRKGKDGTRYYVWEAYEMAVGKAEATAFKRAATKLGKQFGLSLYDPDREEVTEELDLEQESHTTRTASSSKPEIVDGVAHCQSCNKEIKGYTSKTGKTYTTEDLVNMSKRQAGGRILCLNCRQNENN